MLRFTLVFLALGMASASGPGLWTDHITEFELPNGLKFVVLERPSSSSLSVTLLANAGWADDPVGRRGVSRVMERMVEEGGYAFGSAKPAEERKAQAAAEELADKWEAELAKPMPNSLDAARIRVEAERVAAIANTLSEHAVFRRTLERNGATLTQSHADATLTTIITTMPAAAAPVWFEGMAAWLKDPAWRNFYNHRAAAANAAQHIDEQTAVLHALTAQAFPHHAWAAPDLIFADMQKIRIRDLAAFHKMAFAPGNLVISIVGNLPAAQARALAEKYFGSLAPQPPMLHNWSGREVTPFQILPAPPGAQVLAIGYPRSPLNSPDDSVLDVIAHFLFVGQDSYLNTKLVKTLKAANVTGSVSFPTPTGGGLLSIIASPVPGRSLDELRASIQSAIDELVTNPPPPADLLAGKRRYITSAIRLLEEDDSASELLAHASLAYGSAKRLTGLLAGLEAITPADVSRVVQQYLKAGAASSFTWTGDRQ